MGISSLRGARSFSLAALALLASACVPARLLVRPCVDPTVAPLGTKSFAAARVGKVTLPADVTPEEKAKSGEFSKYLFGQEVAADDIVPESMRRTLAEVPVFNGGAWPAVDLDMRLTRHDAYMDGYAVLAAVSILYFPLGWLVGLPTAGNCVAMDYTYVATVGGFRREYRYSVDRCAVQGLYYRGAQIGSVMGHTILALARDLVRDYGQYSSGALPAAPEPVSRDVSTEDAWSVRKACEPFASPKGV